MKSIPKVSFIVLFVFMVCLLSSAQSAPPEVLKAAQTGLPELLHAVIPGYVMLGFDRGDSLEKATLGEPVEVYTVIPTDKINNGIKCKSIISNKKEYYFPIILNGQIRSILTVYKKKTDSTWVASGIGNEILARELYLIRKQWPTEKGFYPYILEFPTIGKVYFSIPQVDEYNMTQVIINNNIKSAASLDSNSNAMAASSYLSSNLNKYAKLTSVSMMVDSINVRVHSLGYPNRKDRTTSSN
jgi:hypothetical protein